MTEKCILLVEDNPSDAELTIRAFGLGRINNEIIVAENGQEALDYLRGEGKWQDRDVANLPALTLLDLKLPKVSGLEVLRRIREADLTRRLPVVILTSSNEQQDVAAGYDLGVNSYIRKPVDFTEFAAAAKELGHYWLELNEPPPEVGEVP
jgi:two-component system response regulator